jgi:hypothetical protein
MADTLRIPHVPLYLLSVATAALVTACGGGGDGATPPPSLSLAQRSEATLATAISGSNACNSIKPFYWEVGDRTATLAAGSTDSAGGTPTFSATTVMPIASASKWIYAAYVAEKRAGALSDADVKFLHFRSGFVSFDAFGSCGATDTVDSCLNNGRNGDYTASSDGRFNYDGGHMQKHASLDGLGARNSVALAAEVRRLLGSDIVLSYSQPQPAGGVVTTAADYARFLRKVLDNSLRMGALLGASPVCTNPATCSLAVATPTPRGESWLYSIGHWVDADPVLGDGSFSSTGAFGFHPWIDASKTTYGVLARRTALPNGAFDSSACGRLLRKAWATGTVQ